MLSPFRKTVLIPTVAFVSGTVLGVAGLKAAQDHNEMALARNSIPEVAQGFQEVNDEMNKIFQRLIADMNGPNPMARQMVSSRDLEDVDLRDMGDEYVYRLPLDGVKDKKVDVRVDRGMVTVTAQSQTSKKLEKGEASETSESISEFQKTFPLVAGANPAKMDFKVENDFIIIRFPKLKGV